MWPIFLFVKYHSLYLDMFKNDIGTLLTFFHLKKLAGKCALTYGVGVGLPIGPRGMSKQEIIDN